MRAWHAAADQHRLVVITLLPSPSNVCVPTVPCWAHLQACPSSRARDALCLMPFYGRAGFTWHLDPQPTSLPGAPGRPLEKAGSCPGMRAREQSRGGGLPGRGPAACGRVSARNNRKEAAPDPVAMGVKLWTGRKAVLSVTPALTPCSTGQEPPCASLSPQGC